MTNFADWQAICETKARYCRCMDTKDWEGYADCFTEDYRLELPPGGAVQTGRDAIVARIREMLHTSKTTHQVHNPEISFDGPDAANVIWAMQDRNVWSEERRRQVGNSGHTGYGHYHERYVRSPDGKWRIQSCRLSYLHMDRYDVEPGA
ncbi:MAG TPA: nuclear transport factor 2 family protein [Sphingobium sp.]|uniref:nuclear transport factor 2 family protein n=1 Tax=Sphingobium sp. TaxID=1912891 RepID=UPI002ED1959D